MDTTTLGRTGLLVTRMGLGLAALGRPGYINLGHADDLGVDLDVATMERRAHEVLDAAWAAGVRYFDAARSYGRAEAFLGSWLTARQIRPGTVTVGSKWGYTYTAGWKAEAEMHEIKDHSLTTLLRQSAESREIPAPTWASTRCTRPRRRPAGWKTARCWRAWPGCAARGGRSG